MVTAKTVKMAGAGLEHWVVVKTSSRAAVMARSWAAERQDVSHASS